MTASLASRLTDICLVPEFTFDLYGKKVTGNIV